jgi:hypothetical protein
MRPLIFFLTKWLSESFVYIEGNLINRAIKSMIRQMDLRVANPDGMSHINFGSPEPFGFHFSQECFLLLKAK